MDEQGDKFMSMVSWLPYNPVIGSRDIPTLTKAESMGINEWRASIKEQFPELMMAAEICMSVLGQLLIHDVRNCTALILIDAPSSGKTICLNFFNEMETLTYSTDNFTPAAFVSCIAGKTQKQLEKIDLLPRVKGKMMIVREMSSIMGENEDRLRERLGLLTRVLDGEGLELDTGVHGKRGYKGDYVFHFLGASTPFPLRVWKVAGGFGHRMFFLNLNTAQVGEDELLAQLQGSSFKVKETLCRDATQTFVRNLWEKNPQGVEWEQSKDDVEALKLISKLALFSRQFRGEIITFKEWSEDAGGKAFTHVQPTIEAPRRIAQTMYNLCRGHAVICGRTHINQDDLIAAVPVVLSSAPNPRPKIMIELIKNNGELSVEQIMKFAHLGKETAKKEMHMLSGLDVCRAELAKEEEETEIAGIPVTSVVGTKKNMLYIHDDFKWMCEGEFLAVLDKMNLLR